jgi:hypothetical protein
MLSTSKRYTVYLYPLKNTLAANEACKIAKTECLNSVNRRWRRSITYKKNAVTFSTHKTVTMVKNTPFQNVMASNLEGIYQPCGDSCCLLLQGRTVSHKRKKGTDTGAGFHMYK